MYMETKMREHINDVLYTMKCNWLKSGSTVSTEEVAGSTEEVAGSMLQVTEQNYNIIQIRLTL